MAHQCPVNGKMLVKEERNKWVQGPNLYVVFLSVVELDTKRSPALWVYTDSWAITSRFTIWSSKWDRNGWMIKGVPLFENLYVSSKDKSETCCCSPKKLYAHQRGSMKWVDIRELKPCSNGPHDKMYQWPSLKLRLLITVLFTISLWKYSQGRRSSA